MLEFTNLSVNVRGTPLLQNISFSLEPNRITVLLGKNGSGKSTLIKCANSLQRFSGSITLDGISIDQLSAADRAKKIACFPQFLPDTPLTVRALTALGRSPHTGITGRLTASDHTAIEKALSLVGLTTFRDRRVSSLSGGEKQRAYLAMLLAQDSEILLMDEPTSSLDTDARRELYSLIGRLVREQNKTLLIVMHDLGEAISIADRIMLLEHGSLIFHDTKERCLSSDILERSFHVKRYTADNRIFFA